MKRDSRLFPWLGVALLGMLSWLPAAALAAGPVVTDVKITPKNINTRSHGNWLGVRMSAPVGYEVTDIDGDTLVISNVGGIDVDPPMEPQWWIYTNPVNASEEPVLMGKFNRGEFSQFAIDNALGGNVEVTVEALLFEGTPLVGYADVKIKSKGGPKPKAFGGLFAR